MRHAQSMFNVNICKITNKYGISWDLLSNQHLFDTYPESFFQELKDFLQNDNPEVVNAILTEEGINQCKKTASTTLKDTYQNIRYAMVSPMRRAIQTFENSFENYPNEKNLKVDLNEHLRETIGAPSDVCCWTEDEFATIDRDRFNWDFLAAKPLPNFWFFESLDEVNKKTAYDLFKGKEDLSVEAKKNILLQDMCSEENFLFKWESENSKIIRVQKAKEILCNKIKAENIQDYEMVIVTHYDTLRMFTAKNFDKDLKPVDYMIFDNAEIKEFDLQI